MLLRGVLNQMEPQNARIGLIRSSKPNARHFRGNEGASKNSDNYFLCSIQIEMKMRFLINFDRNIR